jgi:mono/diheme cytochrome c family protein
MRFRLAMLILISPAMRAGDAVFEAGRAVIETRCIECHSKQDPEGGLVMHTREDFLKGGDSGPALDLEVPEKSELLLRVHPDADEDDRMPPPKDGKALNEAQRTALGKWVSSGFVWPESVSLERRAETALPDWRAEADPRIKGIQVYPAAITLDDAADFHRPIALVHFADETTHDVTRLAKWTLADESIALLDDGTVKPKADGETMLQVEYRGLRKEIPVVVRNAGKARPVSYQLDVLPVLTANGCNAGSCHGSAKGQDGFHLSLYGFDPKGDHFRITEEMPGRRLNLAVPGDSLLVTKAIGAVPHTGGKLIEPDSADHETLVAWIRGGAEYDGADIALPVAIDVEPGQLVMTGDGMEIPLTVRAEYADGSDRDVTRWSAFSSSNDHAAAVAGSGGLVTSKHNGEAFLLARFHTFTEGAQAIVVPANDAWKPFPWEAHGRIDELVAAKLRKLRITPSDLSSDEEFLRRVYLDVIGLPPSVEARESFLSDPSADKRARLIHALTERPEFTDLWVMKWAELLRIRTFNNGPNQISYKAALGFQQWLRERMMAGQPINELARDLLSAEGGTFSSPATNYFQAEQDVLKLAENTAQVFMGTRIQCAQCHNHPFDRWTMDDYYGFASFFAQVRRKPAEDPRERIVFDGGGEMRHPVTKQNMKPRFLGGDEAVTGVGSRREALANWLAEPENPWFARNVANIIWDHFFGVGIVDPVDDMRVSNPASNPELLDALAAELRDSKFNLKQFVRKLCESRTYQLSSRTNASNAGDGRNFSHALVRRVRAEVLLDSIARVTGTPSKFKGLPLGSRAVEIADGNTSNYFLTTFGRATRATVCSCEVKMEPNLSQALHLLNGEVTQNRIRQGGLVGKWMSQGLDQRAILEQLYLSTLCRMPTSQEYEKLLANIPQNIPDKQRQAWFEDMFWALLNSKEFIFNH